MKREIKGSKAKAGMRAAFPSMVERRRNTAMICDECKITMAKKEATDKAPYHYTLSGLKNVFLSGIDILECPSCGIKSAIIPKMDGLHKLITRILVTKPALLNGDEIRFLRKNAGIAAREFAALIEVDPSHLSRIETGKYRSLGAASDKLVRAIAVAITDNSNVRELLLDHAEKKINVKQRQRQLFALEGNRWRPAEERAA